MVETRPNQKVPFQKRVPRLNWCSLVSTCSRFIGVRGSTLSSRPERCLKLIPYCRCAKSFIDILMQIPSRACVVAVFLLAFCFTRSAFAAEALPDGFYRYPTIGGGIIVFAAEGDLWKVPVTGGVALRLTAYEGDEGFPKLSPDGKLLAFTAQYEGNDDVYVMTASGGEPVRLTFHPASDQTLGWTSDGKILFRSRRDTPHNDFRIYKVSPEGGVPEMIPLEPAAWIGFEPNGKRVAFQKLGLEFHNWKRYKGGQAERIYVASLDDGASTEVTHYDGKDAFP